MQTETKRINLTDGDWADILLNPEDISEGWRRKVVLAATRLTPAQQEALEPEDGGELDEKKVMAALGPDAVALLFEINDIAVCASVTGWSLDLPCPPSTEDVLKLRTADYDILLAATAPHAAAIMGKVDFSPNPDQGSPTKPSSGAAGRSRGQGQKPGSIWT